jgi:protein-L-isoaspartate(D-aspartate) O-methyltransferase
MTASDSAATRDAVAIRNELVDALIRAGNIRTAPVEAAFRAVARHDFLPGVAPEQVYRDEAVVTKRLDGIPVSSSSQPAIMAIMLEQLDLAPGQRVLEIGAGTGYNAALIAHLVGEPGHVTTIDIDEDIVAGAREHLAVAGYGRVQVACGDGGLGHADGAPYDRIILTVGASDITPAWWEQLARGGRLVLPLWLWGGQKSVAFEWEDDHLVSRSIAGCGFMVLRGDFAGPQRFMALGPDPTITLVPENPVAMDPESLYRLLSGPSQLTAAGVSVSSDQMRGLGMWLAQHEPGLCRLLVEGVAAERGIVPPLGGFHGTSYGVIGFLVDGGMVLVTRPPDDPVPAAADGANRPIDLTLRAYGAVDAAMERIAAHIHAWESSGRPGGTDTGTASELPRVRAYRVGQPVPADDSARTFTRRWTRFVVEGQ